MMISRVEVEAERLDKTGNKELLSNYTITSIVSFDSNEKETKHHDLLGKQGFLSLNEIVKFIVAKLGVKENIIELKGADIIRTDEDTQNEELYDNGSLYPYDMPAEVDIREEKFTIFEWMRKLKNEQLKLDEEFQRKIVWKNKQKSEFIESILLNMPLPPLFVNQDIEGKYIIIDGLQRTTTLKEYLNEKNGFSLQGLQVLKKFNGKRFIDLDEASRTDIEDKQLFIYVIKPKVSLKMVYDIFNRINTGGTQLNRQEVRNCLYAGKSTRLLKRLSEEEYFRKAIDLGISPQRMKDREAILRCLAFNISSYEKDYKGDMDDFLGDTMKKINKMSDMEIDKLEMDFRRVMILTYDFFGPANFRFPTKKSKGRINITIMETVGLFFSRQTDRFLNDHKERIIENFSRLLKDREFIDAISYSTGSTRNVRIRFEKVFNILGDSLC